MIDYSAKICGEIKTHLADLSEDEVLDILEVPADTNMGDFAFPCFRLAKILRKSPQIIAEELAKKISESDLFEKVEQVNAYVNMFLDRKKFVSEVITENLKMKENFGRSDLGKNKKVIVEYSSPNIAKPFHIGHIRSTVIGNSIYKLYDFLGYDVVRINHLGDYGTQFGKMIVAYRKWGNKEDVERTPIKTLLGYYTKFHEEAENDMSLEDEARKVFVNLENGEEEEVKLWQWFREESLKEFNKVYDMLGISFDSYAGESFYSDKMESILETLREKDLLVESQGAQIVDLEEYKMSPALIKKKDGSTLYITRDIAAAVYRKQEYDFYKNIYVVASQQNLHFMQWMKIVELMGNDWAKDCVHIPFGLVSLESGTMSTRKGRVVFLEDVLNGAVEKTKEIILEKNPDAQNVEEISKIVGIGAVIFQELSNNRIKDYVFSWDKVLNFEGETGPYVQYTHARAASLIRKAGNDIVKKIEDINNIDFTKIVGESEYQLCRLIYQLPKIIEESAEKYEPSMVTRHIVDIAQAFNKFYHDKHILTDDEKEKVANIALVNAAKNSIKVGLSLLGISSPDKM